MKNENMEVLNNFIGYGNPKSDFWFIGIEEHSIDNNLDIEKEERRFNIYEKEYKNNSPYYLTNKSFDEKTQKEDQKNAANSKTYDGILKLYNKILKKENDVELLVKDIGAEESNIFNLNLYPLSRATIQDDYNGFIKEYVFDGGFDKWYDEYWELRKNIIVSFMKQYQPKFIICLGVREWKEFKEIILKYSSDNDMKFKIVELKKGYFGYYKNEVKDITSICTYHPSARRGEFSESYLDDIKNKLK